ncbi:MAG TPA: thioredoxin family protein, partial [Phycisphaerae bacterium]|nr:thioredoxin family protein [Phycisphaerae bacterium]
PPPKPGTVAATYRALALGLLRDAVLQDMEPEWLAKVNDKVITRKYLEDKIASAPAEDKALFEKTRPFLLAQFLQRELLLAEAKKEGLVKDGADDKAENTAIRDLVKKQVDKVQVTDDELKQAYEKYKSQLGGAKFEDIKDRIREVMLESKKQEAMAAYMLAVSKDAKVTLNRKWAEEQNKLITDNEVDKARESGKVTMVEFGAEWCPPCKQMKPVIKQIKDERKDVNIITIDVDQNRPLSMRYGVQNLPTQIYFDVKGEEVFRHEGSTPKKMILDKLDEIKKQKADSNPQPAPAQ